jgi:hypothetical protein
MALKVIKAIIRVRRGTYTQFYNSNPVLKQGELSYITSGQDNGKFKVGNGSTQWRSLPYSAARFPEDVITLSDNDASDALPNSGKIEQLFQMIRNFLKWIKGQFDPWTGHKHNGTDSPKVSYNDLANKDVIENYIDSALNNEAHQRRWEIESLDSALSERIDGVENLGHYAGAFDTYALLPKNTSGFPQGITANDFATIRADETHDGNVTRYIVSGIDAESGDVTWVYDVTYNLDISGKADKVAGATDGNFAGINASGNLADSGKKASDFIPASDKGAPNGVATLDADGLVDASQFPSFEGGLLVVNSDESLTGHGTPDSPLGVNEINAAKITSGRLNSDRIPPLDAGVITTGVLAAARIPNLDASKITTGVLSTDRIPAIVTMQNIQTPLEIGVSALATGKLAFYYGANLTGMPRSQLYIGVDGKAQAAAPASNALDTIMDIFKFNVKGVQNRYFGPGSTTDSQSVFTPVPGNEHTIFIAKNKSTERDGRFMMAVNEGDLFIVRATMAGQETAAGEYTFGSVKASVLPGRWVIVVLGSGFSSCIGSEYPNMIMRRIA